MSLQPKPVVWVTLLETFRKCMYTDCKYVTEQDVIDSITQKFEGNEYTRIGTAFHSIVETGELQMEVPQGERTYLYYGKPKTEEVPDGHMFRIDGYPVILDNDQCATALEYRNQYKGAFHETKIRTDYGNAIISGCADMIHGMDIRDIKTKFSPVSDSDYIDSYQWRYYLEMFGGDSFFFDLFVFDGYDKDKHGMDVRGIPLKRYYPSIECQRYHGMENDNRRLLDAFLEWADFRNVTHYLIRK